MQSSEGNITCKSKPTLVAKTFHRMDLFNQKMRDVLFTSVLVTIKGNHTLGHFGTSDGRILQVAKFGILRVKKNSEPLHHLALIQCLLVSL